MKFNPIHLFYLVIPFLWISRVVDGGLESLGKSCLNQADYFDTSSLSCMKCGSIFSNGKENEVPDTSSLVQKGPSRCTCSPGSYRREIEDKNGCENKWPRPCEVYECVDCSSSGVPTHDKSRCLPCGETTLGVNSLTKDCKCPDGNRIVERNENGEYLKEKKCSACPSNYILSKDLYTCIRCPHAGAESVKGTTCECSSPYVESGIPSVGETTCVPNDRNEEINNRFRGRKDSILFQDFANSEGSKSKEKKSVILKHFFPSAAVNCYFFADASDTNACQILSNICALEHFHVDNAACEILTYLRTVERTSVVHGIKGWTKTLPFLLYENNARSVLTRLDIKMEMKFSSDPEDFMEYQLASYAFNGTFLGFEPLSTQLSYCKTSVINGPSHVISWLQFGVGFSESYNCDLRKHLEANHDDVKFYELYLHDSASDTLVPVPVKVSNYRDENDELVNINLNVDEEEDDQLSHRFFLFDGYTAKDDASSLPSILRYASRISLKIRTQDSKSDRLYPPQLSIEYVDTQDPTTVELSFKVEYTSNTDTFWSVSTAFFSIACVFSFFTGLLNYFNWQKRNNRVGAEPLSDYLTISRFTYYILSSASKFFFWLLVLQCSYYLVFFKLQNSVYTLLPSDDEGYGAQNEYYPFKVLLLLTFFLQIFSVLVTIYLQCSIQIFFLDWEKPRAKMLDEDAVKTVNAPISVWRTILVANEWNELQTIRKTTTELTLIAMVFLLDGLGWKYVAASRPNASDLSPSALNPYLRFAHATWWWLLICYSQIFWKWLVYERYFSEPKASQFVDLCTMAKVSCFLLDERFHGYYLHCRSPYPFADGSMLEITDQLKQEEAGLMSGRGLTGAPADVQTFEVLVTQAWRKKYNKMYATLVAQQTSRTARMRGRLGGLEASSGTRNARSNTTTAVKSRAEKIVKASRKVNTFLKGFVENHDDDHRWKLYSNDTVLYNMLRIPPELSSKRESTFISDKSMGFTRLLLLGIEKDLIVLNILTFAVMDLTFDSPAVAALLTYAAERALISLRECYGKANVAAKTLVDDRFLI